jgi:hypothetical protein
MLEARIGLAYEVATNGAGGPPDLSAIVAALGGLYPSIVAMTLDALELPYSLPRAPPLRESYAVELHPLLYEWYFTREVAEYLASEIPPNAESLLLGVPTVAAAMARRSRYAHLVDASPYVNARFPELSSSRVSHTRVEKLSKTFEPPGVILMDPPWYPEVIKAWLLCAHSIANVGTTIAFSLFPTTTRPTARAERRAVLELARSMGGVSVDHGCLRYQTPLFEEEALRAIGVAAIGDWRQGDLVRIRVTRRQPFGQNVLRWALRRRQRHQRTWVTYVIGRRVVMVATTPTHSGGSLLRPIDGCPANVLTTVSQRDPRRRNIGLWTSRNRVASVGSPKHVGVILRTLESDIELREAVRKVRAQGVTIDLATVSLLQDVVSES